MEYTLHFHDGHPIIHAEQGRVLIDTGSPTTFHDHGRLPFLGQEFQASAARLGLNMEVLWQMTGADITPLMSMDILGRFSAAFCYAEGKISFDAAQLTPRGDEAAF